MNEVREASRQYAVDERSAPAEGRPVRLFRNGANQAVRIPKEFELPGQDALIWREGDRLVIEAVKPTLKKGSPQAMLALLGRWMAEDARSPAEDIDPWADIADPLTSTDSDVVDFSGLDDEQAGR